MYSIGIWHIMELLKKEKYSYQQLIIKINYKIFTQY